MINYLKKEKYKEQDFEQLYNETYKDTCRFIVIKCNDIDLVNDIIQDTYYELLKIIKKKEIEKNDNIQAFINGIAKNIIKRYYTRKKKDTIIDSYEDEEKFTYQEKDGRMLLEDNFITKENIKLVWEYLKKKEVNIFRIFYLYYVSDFKIKDIAKQLDLNESTVKNKIYRTLKELKDFLGKDVI